jgi:hypothetical protein
MHAISLQQSRQIHLLFVILHDFMFSTNYAPYQEYFAYIAKLDCFKDILFPQ